MDEQPYDGTGYPPEKTDQLDPSGKAELDAKETAKPGQEIDGVAVEKFELPETSSPLTPPPPDPVYEMTGDSANVLELPASVERPHEVE